MEIPSTQDVSIIIPTYREAKNIPTLVKRFQQVDFANRHFEVLIVDDNSQDGIVDVVAEFAKFNPWLKLMIHQGKRSLSQSVMAGMSQASFPVIVVMDADLSHPPEKIPQMLDVLSEPGVDFVIGSRYVAGGNTDEKWPVSRKITSKIAALLAKALLTSKVSDPLSGFFAVRKSTCIAGDELQPVGWKIGLEVMVKCHCKNIREIPIHFSERLLGKSKLNTSVVASYLRHIVLLSKYKFEKQ